MISLKHSGTKNNLHLKIRYATWQVHFTSLLLWHINSIRIKIKCLKSFRKNFSNDDLKTKRVKNSLKNKYLRPPASYHENYSGLDEPDMQDTAGEAGTNS